MQDGFAPASATQSQRKIIGEAATIVVIVVLAFAVRYAYLRQIQSIPLFFNLISDSLAYDQWALAIAEGNWLGKGVFYQAPLYPYFLGLLYAFFGHDLWMARVTQILLGALSCGLLYLAGRSIFSRPAGVAAALILCFYAPAVFFDGLIQKSALDLFLVALLLVLLSSFLRAPAFWKSLLLGVIVGLLALARENALVWLAVLTIWIYCYFRDFRIGKRWSWSAALLAGVLIIVLPVGIRNLKAGGEFALTTAQMGPNFYIGNNPRATGTYVPLRSGRGDPEFERRDAQELAEKAAGRSLTPGQVSNYWMGEGWNFIKTEPAKWLALLGRKWLITWNIVEVEDSDDFYIYQQWSGLLRALAPLGNFGVLAPLAAVGIILTLRERRRLSVLYLLILTMAASVALFYVFARYRFPLVPILALFAGAGVVRVYELFKAKQPALLCAAAALAIAAWFVVHIPIVGLPGPTVAGYSNLARMFARSGKPDDAIANYQKALLIEPQNAVVHYNLGTLLGMRGQIEQSKKHLQQAVSVDPNYAEAHSNLGNIFLLLGDVKEASLNYRRALELDPGFDDTRFNLGMALLRAKEFDGAAEQFQILVKNNPANPEAQFLLGNALAASGQLNSAIEKFREVIRLKPDFDDAYVALARALAAVDRTDEAMKVYRKALDLLKAKKNAERKTEAPPAGLR